MVSSGLVYRGHFVPPANPHEQSQVEAAAYLRFKGKSIAMIAKILHVANGKVANLIQKAEAQGLFREKLEFRNDRITPDRLDQLTMLDNFEHLRRRLCRIGLSAKATEQGIFKRLSILSGGGVGKEKRMLDLRLAKFAQDVTPVLSEVLFHSRNVGVAYGTTLSLVINALGDDETGFLKKRKPITFIPTCGEPYGTWLRADSSSSLAAELDRRVNTVRQYVSLSGNPAVIPKTFVEAKEDHIIRKFIESCRNYRILFGPLPKGTKPLIDQVDTLLTSVGAAEGYWRMSGEELCEIGGIERGLFSRTVLGDIGGVLLPKPENSAKDNAVISEWAKLWTGITMSHYQRIARSTIDRGGVVVFAIGANKAPIVLHAIHAGVVNHLVCDEDLALELDRLSGPNL